jgi:hypothetical protein
VTPCAGSVCLIPNTFEQIKNASPPPPTHTPCRRPLWHLCLPSLRGEKCLPIPCRFARLLSNISAGIAIQDDSETDHVVLTRHKWDMGTWRDGLKASPPPEKQAPAHNDQQPLLHEEHHHHHHKIEHHEHHHHHAAPGDAAARVR